MAQRHGVRQQKKLAKQKARRADKRADLVRRDSTDPTLRLKRVATWPVVSARMSTNLSEEGLGTLTIARQEAEGRLVVGVYLVDVLCLGIKNTFWDALTPGEYKELIKKIETHETMRSVAPACVVKVISGAVGFAQSFGFRPHADFRHTAKLLEGIDPSACPEEFTFGREGRPYYVQGPNESPMEVKAIAEQAVKAGGHFCILRPDGIDPALLPLDDTSADDRNWLDERESLARNS